LAHLLGLSPPEHRVALEMFPSFEGSVFSGGTSCWSLFPFPFRLCRAMSQRFLSVQTLFLLEFIRRSPLRDYFFFRAQNPPFRLSTSISPRSLTSDHLETSYLISLTDLISLSRLLFFSSPLRILADFSGDNVLFLLFCSCVFCPLPSTSLIPFQSIFFPSLKTS